MPYKDLEKKRAKDRERSRRRYWSNPEHREATRQRARERQRTPKLTTYEKDRRRKVEARQRLRNQVGQIKLGRGCVDCGYAKHPAALQFDHVNGKKMEIISYLVTSCASWHVIATEIAKCEVRCANCHAIRTVERLQESKEKIASNTERAEQLSWSLGLTSEP